MAKKKEDKVEKRFIVNIRKLNINYELRYEFSPMINEYIKTLPKEHRQIRKDSIIDADGEEKDDWVRIIREVAMGKIICFFLDNSIEFEFQNVPKENIDKLVFEYKERQKKLAEILKLKGEAIQVDNIPFEFMKRQPYPYQKQAVRFFEINNGRAILGDQPGLGKTCAAFTYAVKHKLKTLVICPSSVKSTWKNEITNFTFEKSFVFKQKPTKKSTQQFFTKKESLFHIINFDILDNYIKIEYKHKCKGKLLKPNGGQANCTFEEVSTRKIVVDEKAEVVYEINKETGKKKKKKVQPQCPVCKSQGTIKTVTVGFQLAKDSFGEELIPTDYDLIVIDELHKMKEKKVSWTQIITMAFRDVIKKKILLSGTAIKSRPYELFVPLNFVDPQEWNNQHDYGIKYCAAFEDTYGWKYDGASNLEQLYERISGLFLRRKKKDVLKDLPEKTYTYCPIELTSEEYSEYDKLLESCKKEINGSMKEESYLVKVNKLKQFLSQCKLLRVKDLIQETIDSGEKIVTMSDLQAVAEEVCKLFPGVSVKHMGGMSDDDKWNVEEKFRNQKDIKVFSGMILASGVGLNLQVAGKLVFLGYAWTPGDMEQAEDRIHRNGSEHDNIQIIIPYCLGTIDEDIIELLNMKENVVSRVLDNKANKKTTTDPEESIFKKVIQRIKEAAE